MTTQLKQDALSKGLHFRRFDLHVHTPASKDYTGSGVTKAEEIVDAALQKGLAGIAIADHQTGEWIDIVKKAARGSGLIVFPAVELLVTGGEEGVHVLIVFDVDKDSKHVDQFLNKLGIFERRGERTIAADKTVGQVADEVEKYDPSAIMVLPHCHSSKGVLADIKGETRTLIFEQRRRCILGAEASEADFQSEEKKAKHKRVVDVLDGTDKNYHFRKLGVYSSSDAHSLEEIGRSYAYFKVDEPITIEDIRQCLIDRETRIRQSFEFQIGIYPHVSELKVDSGFLADQVFQFHEGLNSILGAKGAGKSLAIEFLRFALDQPPSAAELQRDHEAKLEKCLKPHGKVEVVVTDESGKRYQITRTYNPAEGNRTEIVDLDDGTEKQVEVDQLFPVLFLSQGEVTKIAEDRTGAGQRQFIDTFFDFRKFQNQIETLNKELSEVDGRFADVFKSRLASADTKRKLATYQEELQKLERQIRNPIFSQYSKKEKVGRAIQSQQEFIETLRTLVVNTKTEFGDLTAPLTEDVSVASDPAVKRTVDKTNAILQKIQDAIDSVISFLDNTREEVAQEYQSWESAFKPTKGAYDDAVKAGGGTQLVLDQKRKMAANEIAKLEATLSKLQGKAGLANSVAAKRNEILDGLDHAYKAYFEERKSRCEMFTTSSLGALKVTIKEREDTTAFKDNLLSLKRGSWLREEEIEKISESVSPRDFVTSLLRYEWSFREKKDSLKGLTGATGMKPETTQKLAEYLLDTHEYKDILALLYTSVPKDVPSISYKVGEKFKDLSELSVGQKAVALLIIALSDGTFPIIIDQPEDSLDLRSIWDDLCHKLRGSKEHRQFIFTTHNSSVAVASDSDKFTILEATADQGKVVYSGSINRPEMKKEIIDYLEGGKQTYDQKKQKYNL
jgi:predicted  nucleic acid-binding Zn-ribbon protein